MELKDFIKATLKDISEAISESNAEMSDVGLIANPKNVHTLNSQTRENVYGYMTKPTENSDLRRPVHLVNFDVSVSTSTSSDGSEGIGVNVVGIKLGKDGSKAAEDSASSRLQFSIPVALPNEKS